MPSPARWEELCRTAAAVQAPLEPEALLASHREWGRMVAAGALVAAGLAAGAYMQSRLVSADSAADADLFSLTNQDRTSNGVAALAESSTLSSIGEAAPYTGCSGAGTIYGRAQDMINRDYFAHQIPPCEQYVWSMMSAYGVHYGDAGENIGWVSGESSESAAAEWINNAFMQSTGHRDNILDPSYTTLGVGSATTAAGQSWTCPASEGCSGSYQNVWIFAEEFAQITSSAPPPTPKPTPPPPAPTSTPRPAPPEPTPSHPATATPAPTPAATPTPTATPTPDATPTPSPTPAPQAATTLPLPAYGYAGGGLISDTIESTLEAILFP
jgi:uncharacterized protein YkwD